MKTKKQLRLLEARVGVLEAARSESVSATSSVGLEADSQSDKDWQKACEHERGLRLHRESVIEKLMKEKEVLVLEKAAFEVELEKLRTLSASALIGTSGTSGSEPTVQ